MSKIVFLDSSVFIWGYNRADSNSGKILNLMDEGEITVVVSEKVMDELRRYFINHYSKDVWSSVFRHLTSVVEIISAQEIAGELNKWRGRIKDKDLEHLATVKHLGLKYLIGYDYHFEGFEEYRTPRQFIIEQGLSASETEY